MQIKVYHNIVCVGLWFQTPVYVEIANFTALNVYCRVSSFQCAYMYIIYPDNCLKLIVLSNVHMYYQFIVSGWLIIYHITIYNTHKDIVLFKSDQYQLWDY